MALISGFGTTVPPGSVGYLPSRAAETIRQAEIEGLICWRYVDEWRPGMKSGAGWKRYARLTLAGQRLAESAGHPPDCHDLDADGLLHGHSSPHDDNVPSRDKALAQSALQDWLTVTEAARLLMEDIPGLGLKAARARVSTAASRGQFRTNGERRRKRRIERHSFSTWRIVQRDRDLDAEG